SQRRCYPPKACLDNPVKKSPSKRRVFGKRSELLFHSRSSFVLTKAGLRAARLLIGEIPFYNRDMHELRVRGQLVKNLKQPAPDQDAILSSFEELGWPRRIDDPLPRKPSGQDPKLRLRDAIKRLNQRQNPHLVHFRGDGRGQGIIWEIAD